MNAWDRFKRWLLPTLGVRYYAYYYQGRARYVGKPGHWKLVEVSPLEGAVDQRALADIPTRISRRMP